MLLLTQGEKQLILWAKNNFYLSPDKRIKNYLRILTANNFNLPVNQVEFKNIDSFIINVFLKLKNNSNIFLGENEEKTFLYNLLGKRYPEQLELFLCEIADSVFDDDFDLGQQDLSLLEKEDELL